MLYKVECPICQNECDLDNYMADLPSNENSLSFDVECDHCEKEFEVFVEFHPRFSSKKIEYFACENCGEETRKPYRRGRVFPYPSELIEENKNVVCEKCYLNGMKELL